MKRYKHVFYGYSPYHAIFFINYINKSRILNDTLITGPDAFLAQIRSSFINKNREIKFLPLPNTATNLSILRRIIGRLIIYLKLRNIKCINLYSANELAFPSIVLEKNSQCECGVLLDEGFLQGAVRKEKVMVRYKLKYLLRNLINFSSKKRFDTKIYNILYTRDISFFREYLLDSPFEICDATPFITLENTVKLKDYVQSRATVFLLTSPLTENNNSKYPGQEIDLLEKLIERNPHRNFLLKPHYREDQVSKYEKLLRQKNCDLMPEQFLSLSSQTLDFSGFSVVGFHSSALIDIARTGNADVFSLSQLVDSQHSKSVLPALSELIMINEDLDLK